MLRDVVDVDGPAAVAEVNRVEAQAAPQALQPGLAARERLPAAELRLDYMDCAALARGGADIVHAKAAVAEKLYLNQPDRSPFRRVQPGQPGMEAAPRAAQVADDHRHVAALFGDHRVLVHDERAVLIHAVGEENGGFRMDAGGDFEGDAAVAVLRHKIRLFMAHAGFRLPGRQRTGKSRHPFRQLPGGAGPRVGRGRGKLLRQGGVVDAQPVPCPGRQDVCMLKVQIHDFFTPRRRPQPMAPSISSLIRLFISTAYSTGSSLAIGSAKPVTIIAFASSSEMPRLIR